MDLLPLETATFTTEVKTLSVLRPNVTREQAIALLSPSALRLLSPSLRSVAEFYVPFQLFRARIFQRSAADEKLMAVDLFSGLLDPFEFPEMPAPHLFISTQSRNRPEPALSLQQASDVLRTKVQRLIFQVGFFRAGHLKLEIEPVTTFYMPYWIGFYGGRESVSIEVLDAIRRVKEGAKFRRLVTDWIVRQDEQDQTLPIRPVSDRVLQ
jgi:hypothetical protein